MNADELEKMGKQLANELFDRIRSMQIPASHMMLVIKCFEERWITIRQEHVRKAAGI
jgi:hypothetical protein